MSISLPNIRKLFIPDPGYTIFEADQEGADAQVVAWEAEDEALKAAFRAGLDIHSFNAEMMMGTRFTSLSLDDPLRRKLRQQNKQAVHATNYVGHARSLSTILGWTVAETEAFQLRWLSAHPGILKWHQKIEFDLRTKRKVTNAFGYSRTYFDRIDQLLAQAVAWIPQSTVALVTSKAGLRLRAARTAGLLVEYLMQVHDSNIFQIPTPVVTDTLRKIRPLIHITVPYPDPLIIPWGLAGSTKSWGDAKDMPWPEEQINRPVPPVSTARLTQGVPL